jgi:hypothetical protein
MSCTSTSQHNQQDSLSPLYARSVAYLEGEGVRLRRQGYSHRPGENTLFTAFAVIAHSTMAQKRRASDDDDGPAKQIKTEHPEEFSNAVKKRLQSSSRTGQACDRCKVRSQTFQTTGWFSGDPKRPTIMNDWEAKRMFFTLQEVWHLEAPDRTKSLGDWDLVEMLMRYMVDHTANRCCRSGKFDAMAFPEAVLLACRTLQNVGLPIELRVERRLGATWRGLNNRTATCKSEYKNWSRDWHGMAST